MLLDNKLGKTNSAQLANIEEKLIKKKASLLFTSGELLKIEVGTFKGLATIHSYLFSELFGFTGKIRYVNIAKDNFQFAPRIF